MLVCVSPGDRITVLDDSNEEWWRVSLTSFCLDYFILNMLLQVQVSVEGGLKVCSLSIFSGKDGG